MAEEAKSETEKVAFQDGAGPAENPANPRAREEVTFMNLEKEFTGVLEKISADEQLQAFGREYEKLYNALKKSYSSEHRLMSKCRELQAEIASNSARVATAIKMSQDDQQTISSLKEEIEKAWKMVDTAQDKELFARETIQNLKTEIANLNKMLDQGTDLIGQETNMVNLVKIKEELNIERDNLLTEVTGLRQELQDITGIHEKLEKQYEETKETVAKQQQEIQMKNNEVQREQRRKERVERELKNVKSNIETKEVDIKGLQQELLKAKENMMTVEQTLKEQKSANEQVSKEADVLTNRFHKLQDDYETQLLLVDQVAQENQKVISELKAREEELATLRHEAGRMIKMKEALHKKLKTLEDQKRDLEQEREYLRGQIGARERELETGKKQMEMDRKAVDSLVRERDTLNKNLLKAAGATQKQMNLVILHEQAKKNLENEIQNYSSEATKQRKIIFQLEKDRDRYINEVADLTQKVGELMEDVKLKEVQVFEEKKRIAEAESKLKQQQNMYEAVRSDRNLYCKNLNESQEEIAELKQKLKIMMHQIDQLKEDINNKEAALIKENLEHQRLEKEKDSLHEELQRMKQEAQETKKSIDTMETEHHKLTKVLANADQEHQQQKKVLEQIISERDILGTQLVRRNEELSLLYEKIKIHQSTLNKGELQYRQRQEDIRLLKLEIKKLRREKGLLHRSVHNIEDLRREVYHLQRELLRECTRCRALEEELQNPLNIHRWRKLKGSDPGMFELLQKLHTLQRRLLSKTEEVVEQELQIQEKEKLYLELKKILARQPGPEVAEQLHHYQQVLKSKTRQLKGLTSELNMYESQVSEYKFDMERLSKELEDVKKKYFIQKKKDLQYREKQLVNSATHSQDPGLVLPHVQPRRFTGGGFHITLPGKQQAVK